MKCRADLTFLVAGLTGALVWVASPMLSGYREPWDADGFYYLGALIVAGSFTGAMLPGPLWALYLGALTGQIIYEALFLKIGPLFFVGLLFLCGYSLIFVLSAAVAKQIRLHFAN